MRTREYRAPVRHTTARVVLAAVLGAIMLVSTVLLGALALGPGHVVYRLEGGELEVDSGSLLDGSRRFSVDRVSEARVVELRGGRRTMGTAMPGLCTGRWEYADLGPVWQATDCSRRAVVLHVRGEERPVLVTPRDPDRFLETLEARRDATFDVGQPNVMALRLIGGGAAAVSFASLGAILALFLWGPRSLRYRLEGGQLEIQTLFGKSSWPAHQLTARRHGLTRALRVMGAGLPGYYTGRFRADGEATRVYATSLDGGVLLEGPARIFITPEDAQGFLEALRDEGGHVVAARA